MIVATVVLVLVALLLIGVPIGFSMALAGALGLYWLGGHQVLYGITLSVSGSGLQSYELITVPMFILMAEFMVMSGIAASIFRTAATWVGRVPGGLAVSTALAGAGLGALSGSSTASAATLSATSIPAMLEKGYEPKLATGVVAISGTLAMLIPPSIALVLYGIIADVNIGRLLIGGVVPGLMVTVAIIATVLVLIALDPKLAPRGEAFTMWQKIVVLRETGPALVLLFFVTGSIYFGFATPTEASSLGALGAMLLCLLMRRLTLSNLLAALARTAAITCMIFLMILGAKIFGYFISLSRMTHDLLQFIGGLEVPGIYILALILIVYFLLGFFMDQIAILVLTVPVTLPVVVSLGHDPVWFGVVIIVIAELGLVTPPFGLNVFVVSKYTGRRAGEIFAGVAPHLVAHIAVVVLLVAYPALVLWLPSQM